MRRLPQIVSFLLFIALCASVAYWAMQLFKPPVRPVAAPPRVAQAEVRPDAAASLFGSRKANAAVASNYQLRGVIFSGSPRSSVAIISADGKPAQAIRVDQEVAPGVTIKEVHRDHVLLSEGGTTKRVELPESAKGLEGIAAAPTSPVPRTPTPPPPPPVSNQPVPTRAQAAAAAQAAQSGQQVPGVPQMQPPPQAVTPQNAPSPQQPVPGAIPPGTPPIPGTVPQSTTAPPTTVVSPAPGVPGAPIVPGTVPGQPVPGTVPQAPAR